MTAKTKTASKAKGGAKPSPESVLPKADLYEAIDAMLDAEAEEDRINAMPTPPKPRVVPNPPIRRDTHAASKVLGASRIRAEAEANQMERPDSRSGGDLALADRIEGAALAVLPPGSFEVGAGGEIVPVGNAYILPAHFKNTVQAPSYVTAAASRTRMDMADQCGVLEVMLDISETIQAENSIEKLIASQMAQLHKVAMMAGQRAAECFENGAIDKAYREHLAIQGGRYTNAMARASAEFQNCAATIQKLRSGGKQSITVTHIQNTQVNDGGKAVVTSGAVPGAGAAEAGGGK